ncbi:hypothetical protein LJC61_06645 [Ruminococcaceae bacterium OttesenSCG-928-A16]|nr:hypothetical protein [Ruminococcaceae bacterium OttesenSCG-928-A16]
MNEPYGQPAPNPYSAPQPAPPAPRPAKGTNWFLANILGLIPFVLFAFSIVALTPFVGHKQFSPINIRNIIYQFSTTAPLVVGFVITTRAKGLDLSLGLIMMAGGYVYASSGSIALALLFGLASGAIVGVLTVVLRVPSMLASLGVGTLLSNLVSSFSDNQLVKLGDRPVSGTLWPFVAALVAIAGFLYVLFTPLGKPYSLRKTVGGTGLVFPYFAYPIAGLFACIAGIMQTQRLNAGIANLNFDAIVPLLIWAAISCSMLLDNRMMPMVAGLGVYFLYIVLINSFNLLGFANYPQRVLVSVFIILMLAAAGVAQWQGKKAAPAQPAPYPLPAQNSTNIYPHG